MGKGQGPRVRHLVGAHGRVVSRGDFERACGVCGRPQDVLDLGGFRQRVQERGTGCSQGCARCLGGRRLTRVPRLQIASARPAQLTAKPATVRRSAGVSSILLVPSATE